MSWVTATPLLALAAALLITGCESTQDKSARLEKTGGAATREKGLRISKESSDVKVTGTAVIADANGAAAVVELRNTTERALARVPLAIDVTDGARSLFKNDEPGLEPSLVGVPTLPAGGSLAWVNDEILSEGKAKAVKATVGADSGRAPADLPRVEVGRPTLRRDPTSGLAAEGKIVNRSKVLQRELTLFAVARKGERIVAAGRGQVERLKAGKTARYQIFFIGNPRGARIEIAAPPTNLK